MTLQGGLVIVDARYGLLEDILKEEAKLNGQISDGDASTGAAAEASSSAQAARESKFF